MRLNLRELGSFCKSGELCQPANWHHWAPLVEGNRPRHRL